MCQARGGRLRFGEASSVHPHTEVQPESREFVASAQQRGREVNPWTGNGARKEGQEKSKGASQRRKHVIGPQWRDWMRPEQMGSGMVI